jgi:uncharacterized protein
MAETGPSAHGPVVRVRGESRMEVEPEIARFAVEVRAQDKDRHRTVRSLSARNELVVKRIRACGDSLAELHTGMMRVSPVLRDRRGERARNYQGRVRLTAELEDFDALGSLLAELATGELTQVEGPWWRLRGDSPRYAEARAAAVREAVERARIYARALGSELTGLVELADTGLSSALRRDTSDTSHVTVYRTSSGAVPEQAGAPDIGLEPRTIEVEAHVEATFTISTPDEL